MQRSITGEAIYNSLFRATTSGRGRTVAALLLDRTVEVLRKHGLIGLLAGPHYHDKFTVV